MDPNTHPHRMGARRPRSTQTANTEQLQAAGRTSSQRPYPKFGSVLEPLRFSESSFHLHPAALLPRRGSPELSSRSCAAPTDWAGAFFVSSARLSVRAAAPPNRWMSGAGRVHRVKAHLSLAPCMRTLIHTDPRWGRRWRPCTPAVISSSEPMAVMLPACTTTLQGSRADFVLIKLF